MFKLSKSFFPILLVSGLLLTSCQNKIETSNTTSQSDDISNDFFTSGNNTTSQDNSQNSSYLWSSEVDSLLYEILGSSYKSLPVYESAKYECSTRVENDIRVVDIKAYTDDENCGLTYSIVLKSNGFVVKNQEYNGNNYYIANLKLSIYQDLYVTYLFLNDGNESYLSISTYIVDTLLQSWPSEKIIDIFGYDIPNLDAQSYQFNSLTQNGIDIVQIYCFGLEDLSAAEIEYKNTLESQDYIVFEYQGIFYAHNDLKNIEVDFYSDIENDCIYLQAYLMQGEKNWPTDSLKSLYDFDIPEYYEVGVRYNYGLQEYNGSYFFLIDCYYVSPDSENIYKQILEENSFIYQSQYDYDEYGYIFSKKTSTDDCTIQFFFDYNYMALSIYFIL